MHARRTACQKPNTALSRSAFPDLPEQGSGGKPVITTILDEGANSAVPGGTGCGTLEMESELFRPEIAACGGIRFDSLRKEASPRHRQRLTGIRRRGLSWGVKVGETVESYPPTSYRVNISSFIEPKPVCGVLGIASHGAGVFFHRRTTRRRSTVTPWASPKGH